MKKIISHISHISRFFDIYSPDPRARLVVFLTMFFGAYLLIQDLEARSAVGAWPFLLLAVVNYSRFLENLEGLLTRQPILLVLIPLLILFGRFSMVPPAASDDLLRHIAVSSWGGDYRSMYVYSYLPKIGFYPTFDWALGQISALIGFSATMWAIQALAIGSFVAVFIAAARRIGSGHPLWMSMAVLALSAALLCMGYRLILGRPEIFLLVWALAAAAVNGRIGAVVWTATGAVLATGYWLAPISFPAALLLPTRIRERVIVMMTLGSFWLGFWWITSEGQFIQQFFDALRMTANRIPGMHVGENQTLLGLLFDPLGLALVLIFAVAQRQPGADNRVVWLVGYFALSNQIRYVGIIVPLLLLHSMSAICSSRVRLPALFRSCTLVLASVCFISFASKIQVYEQLPRFKLPEGATVLTGFSESTYSTPFENPGKVRVAPAMEIGWLDTELQKVVLRMNGGKFDCAVLERYPFSHLIESTLKGPTPDCLKLKEVQGRWRLWSVVQ